MDIEIQNDKQMENTTTSESRMSDEFKKRQSFGCKCKVNWKKQIGKRKNFI